MKKCEDCKKSFPESDIEQVRIEEKLYTLH
jgi:hypothetical protein